MPLTPEDTEEVRSIAGQVQTDSIKTIQQEITRLQEQINPTSLARLLDSSYFSIENMRVWLQILSIILTVFFAGAVAFSFIGLRNISDIREDAEKVRKKADEVEKISEEVRKKLKEYNETSQGIDKLKIDLANIQKTDIDHVIRVITALQGVPDVNPLIDAFTNITEWIKYENFKYSVEIIYIEETTILARKVARRLGKEGFRVRETHWLDYREDHYGDIKRWVTTNTMHYGRQTIRHKAEYISAVVRSFSVSDSIELAEGAIVRGGSSLSPGEDRIGVWLVKE